MWLPLYETYITLIPKPNKSHKDSPILLKSSPLLMQLQQQSTHCLGGVGLERSRWVNENLFIYTGENLQHCHGTAQLYTSYLAGINPIGVGSGKGARVRIYAHGRVGKKIYYTHTLRNNRLPAASLSLYKTPRAFFPQYTCSSLPWKSRIRFFFFCFLFPG